MDQSNRHAADRLADVRSQLKELEQEEASLRSYILRHPDDLTGEQYEAIISERSRKHVDLESLEGEVSAAVVKRHTTTRSIAYVL